MPIQMRTTVVLALLALIAATSAAASPASSSCCGETCIKRLEDRQVTQTAQIGALQISVQSQANSIAALQSQVTALTSRVTVLESAVANQTDCVASYGAISFVPIIPAAPAVTITLISGPPVSLVCPLIHFNPLTSTISVDRISNVTIEAWLQVQNVDLVNTGTITLTPLFSQAATIDSMSATLAPGAKAVLSIGGTLRIEAGETVTFTVSSVGATFTVGGLGTLSGVSIQRYNN